MENSNFIIRVPEPCHEDWNKMKPEEKGRFCNSCSKTVVDFSNKTDHEIKSILEKNIKGQMCGHFKKSQLDRPLNYKLDLKNLPNNITTTKAFAIALFLVFGSILFSCTNAKEQNVEVVGMLEPPSIEIATTGAPMMHHEDLQVIEKIENTIEGEMICITESFVNGGIGYHDTDPIKDSIIENKIAVDSITDDYSTMMTGVIIMDDHYDDKTLPTTDSIVEKNTVAQIGDNVISKNTDLSIYPNPSTGEFIIKYDVTQRADVRVDIFDVKGSLIKTVVNTPNQYEGKYQIPVNLSELPSGIYIINLINNGKRFTEKVVIGK